MITGSWQVIEQWTGWKPKALRNKETLQKIRDLQVLKHEIVKNTPGRPLTEEQLIQLRHRGYKI